ncbi:hypothetical protein GCM10023196_084660 [Actinoallomurus vinaceus]|uniref:Uncharacterized protein n=1 Tax=Actinoallomurus vinaceus TaxID=1080074 RepID=A0ABP8UQE3_9ACTN
MSEMEVYPADIRTSAGGVTSSADAVQGHVNSHQANMADMADVCGDDDLGSLILGCYQAIHEVAFGSYNDNNSELHNHAKTLNAMADNYDAGEQANTYEVNNVNKYL